MHPVSKDVGHRVYHLDKELRQTKGLVSWARAYNPDSTDHLLEEAMGDLKDTALFGS